MFKNVLIIGCGLIGSSVLRALYNKKLSKKIYVLEKSKKNISKIKKIKTNCKFIKSLNHEISNIDLVIICTPMSEYKNIYCGAINISPKQMVAKRKVNRKKIMVNS